MRWKLSFLKIELISDLRFEISDKAKTEQGKHPGITNNFVSSVLGCVLSLWFDSRVEQAMQASAGGAVGLFQEAGPRSSPG